MMQLAFGCKGVGRHAAQRSATVYLLAKDVKCCRVAASVQKAQGDGGNEQHLEQGNMANLLAHNVLALK